MLKFIDLFAGAGGLSEGFIREGFEPVAHVEIDKHACDTLQTRIAYHFLKKSKQKKFYNQYLMGKISRDSLLKKIPEFLVQSVINSEISEKNIKTIFTRIDEIENHCCMGYNNNIKLIVNCAHHPNQIITSNSINHIQNGQTIYVIDVAVPYGFPRRRILQV